MNLKMTCLKYLTVQRAAGVEKFYLPAIDNSVLVDLFGMEKEYPGKCFAMAGGASLLCK
jgi:hypothetical protein